MTNPWSDSGDPNLCLGMYALQANFINRETLLQALDQWFVSRSTPLGQVLEESGAITLEQHQVLRQWVGQVIGLDPSASVAAAPPSPPPPLPAASRYRVKDRIASGGLGQVSVAHDEVLGRDVALKEILEGSADDPHKRARFLLEAQVTGRLEHPGIVPVYDLSRDAAGRPFYAMRRIEGMTLRKAIECYYGESSHPPVTYCVDFRSILHHFVAVCKTIAYAHDRGIIHRDLKPENIMLGPYGEALVVDWGLAKMIGVKEADGATDAEAPADPQLTRAGAAVGTPTFMSPEQAAGDLALVGPASDVYSLGATLYQIITGRPPVEGATLAETLDRVRRGDIPPPRQVKPAVPAPLDAICRKAMALRPADRYASALLLAHDVELWMAGQPISVYPDPWQKRMGRWLRDRVLRR